VCLSQEWENHPDVLYAHPLVEAGKKVVGGGDGLPTWVCEFMVRQTACLHPGNNYPVVFLDAVGVLHASRQRCLKRSQTQPLMVWFNI
jgi:hypothetical protein